MELGKNLSPKAQIDYELVVKARDHQDEKAYAILLEKYKDSIFYMMLKMVKNQDDADDLTIEAFGKAFNRLHQYTPDYAFSTWLFKIATNNCIDFIRKKKMVTFSIDKGFEDGEGNTSTFDIKENNLNPEEKFMRKQKIRIMREMVDHLKPRYKQLIVLRYFRELSYDEIAETTELPLGTVKAQLFRAREMLYNLLLNKKDRF
ncbi:MAG: sigma-70 family RNA polymerase sigma factor [Flavobacteriales bacterium]|jgi:RNA polymerase sigma-70 factor (ECF subfamily)|nr:sigma-70 family RNA polymerase sigma factor [Flavobacteriales bacterium]MCW8912330.1 sigma-70 family RNA polymerase sigma factor [Flavobacteriales bacterium]MCW8938061.1 sigma-70 family RNA polymerase sigma factor [Flavobacteriales bacterium]MCW8940817.1 sigma-70 family RNA polymerase sigma factor [Flavobacteriales bacterium]MCW8968909.1 sigma-70 family RNA polymerase sigma factor [Flavobacteriales bacterium]